jgi:hypothetical protein
LFQLDHQQEKTFPQRLRLRSLLIFTLFYQKHKYIDQNWLEWFIGFVEGGLYTRASGRLSFVITQQEENILQHIKSVLGFGVVRFDSGVNAYRYIVEDKASILLLAYLFNGNLVLPHRIAQLNAWVSVIAARSSTVDLVAINKAAVFSLEDAWL